MTKIWCIICHQTDFGIFPPSKQHVVDHMNTYHEIEVDLNNLKERSLFEKDQNLVWEERRVELQEHLNTFRRPSPKRGERDESPDGDIFEGLRQALKEHMEVFDDGEEDFDAPQIAMRAGGCGYRTMAHRSGQIGVAVERMKEGGVHQQMFIPASAQGVGWHRMAVSEFRPVDAGALNEGHECGDGSRCIDQVVCFDMSERDAAEVLMGMRVNPGAASPGSETVANAVQPRSEDDKMEDESPASSKTLDHYCEGD